MLHPLAILHGYTFPRRDRGGSRHLLHLEGERIGLSAGLPPASGSRTCRARRDRFRKEELPPPDEPIVRMGRRVRPPAEVSDDAHSARVRRPHREGDSSVPSIVRTCAPSFPRGERVPSRRGARRHRRGREQSDTGHHAHTASPRSGTGGGSASAAVAAGTKAEKSEPESRSIGIGSPPSGRTSIAVAVGMHRAHPRRHSLLHRGGCAPRMEWGLV